VPESPDWNPLPHWFAPPPPHQVPDGQVVQTGVWPPHPSPWAPHGLPRLAQVAGVQL